MHLKTGKEISHEFFIQNRAKVPKTTGRCRRSHAKIHKRRRRKEKNDCDRNTVLRGIITDGCLLSEFIYISQVVLVPHAHDSYLHALLDTANETTQTNTITTTLTL